jgi:hypothetical protein
MAEVQTSEVDAKPAPVCTALSKVKFGNHCWAVQESIVVKQWVRFVGIHCGTRIGSEGASCCTAMGPRNT